VLQMKGCRNAGAGFAMSVCLVPLNVTIVECNCVCVCVCVCVCGDVSCVRASVNVV
jgi:hypothetical protein